MCFTVVKFVYVYRCVGWTMPEVGPNSTQAVAMAELCKDAYIYTIRYRMSSLGIAKA